MVPDVGTPPVPRHPRCVEAPNWPTTGPKPGDAASCARASQRARHHRKRSLFLSRARMVCLRLDTEFASREAVAK
jgi:hypothetical protein